VSFEETLLNEMHSKSFNSAVYQKNFKKRPHISKSNIDASSNAKHLKTDHSITVLYTNELVQRYVAATQLIYDLLFSVYELNTTSLFCARIYKPTETIEKEILKFLKGFHRPNFEVRIIGLQNGQKYPTLSQIADLTTKYELPVVEIDLFGKEARHIAMDAKLGMSFNILMEDRLYKPGELINNTTVAQFERSLKK